MNMGGLVCVNSHLAILMRTSHCAIEDVGRDHAQLDEILTRNSWSDVTRTKNLIAV